MSLLPGSTEQYINAAAEKLRSAAPETTETYAAYGVGKELYLECAKQAAYLTAGKEAKGGTPKDGLIAGLEEEAAGQGLSEKAKFWYDGGYFPSDFSEAIAKISIDRMQPRTVIQFLGFGHHPAHVGADDTLSSLPVRKQGQDLEATFC